MAIFAQFDGSNLVVAVKFVAASLAPNEAAGIAWLKSRYGEETNWAEAFEREEWWLMTAAERYNYPGIGDTWDADIEGFIRPQPYPSWSLNDHKQWHAPTPPPDDGKLYHWDEAAQEWVY